MWHFNCDGNLARQIDSNKPKTLAKQWKEKGNKQQQQQSSNKTNEMKKQETKGRKTHTQIKEISGKS